MEKNVELNFLKTITYFVHTSPIVYRSCNLRICISSCRAVIISNSPSTSFSDDSSSNLSICKVIYVNTVLYSLLGSLLSSLYTTIYISKHRSSCHQPYFQAHYLIYDTIPPRSSTIKWVTAKERPPNSPIPKTFCLPIAPLDTTQSCSPLT